MRNPRSPVSIFRKLVSPQTSSMSSRSLARRRVSRFVFPDLDLIVEDTALMSVRDIAVRKDQQILRQLDVRSLAEGKRHGPT